MLMIDDLIRWLQHKEAAARYAETATDDARRYFDAKMQAFSEAVEHLRDMKRTGRPVLTIGDCVDVFGFILCPTCDSPRSITAAAPDRGRVAPCKNCGAAEYWNLFAEKALE